MADLKMRERVCLITGANSGIGFETARQLAAQGATTALLCRSAERGEAARRSITESTGNKSVELVLCDLASQADVRRAAAEVLARFPRLHVLVNNAALFLPKREVTVDGIEKTFAVNYLSHFLLTNLLLDRLKASAPARIISVAAKATAGTRVGFDDLMLEKGYSVLKAVPQSKLAQIMFTRALARRLAGSGVTANALHPGLVKSELLDQMPWIMRALSNLLSTTPEKGARTPVYLASADEVAPLSGKMFDNCKVIELPGMASDDAAAERLWAVSLKLCGLGSAAE